MEDDRRRFLEHVVLNSIGAHPDTLKDNPKMTVFDLVESESGRGQRIGAFTHATIALAGVGVIVSHENAALRRERDGWRDIESAPKESVPFLSLNHDGEVFVAVFDELGRICFRTHEFRRPERYEHVKVGEEILLRKDDQFTKDNEAWEDKWTLWMNGYEFKPTHWMPLPSPPAKEEG